MEIRPLRLDDLDPLLALFAQLNPRDAPLPPRADTESIWRDLLRMPGCTVFGGFADSALIATCTLVVVPNLTRGGRPWGVIENVVTHEAWRRQGHGRRLLAHALEHAWALGCYKVMLQTGRRDDATIRFYAGAGFDPHEKQSFVARPPR